MLVGVRVLIVGRIMLVVVMMVVVVPVLRDLVVVVPRRGMMLVMHPQVLLMLVRQVLLLLVMVFLPQVALLLLPHPQALRLLLPPPPCARAPTLHIARRPPRGRTWQKQRPRATARVRYQLRDVAQHVPTHACLLREQRAADWAHLQPKRPQ